ncbi:methyltransferase [Myxococcota bacterium]|nr:methyltransferase [Myxococcota bacterium]
MSRARRLLLLACLVVSGLAAGCASQSSDSAPVASAATSAGAASAAATSAVATATGAVTEATDAAASTAAVAATSKAVLAASTAAHRSPEHIARNVYRHPVETLAFFGLRDDMTVVEALPGELWYTEILAPVLREKGKLVAASFDPATPNMVDYQRNQVDLLVRRIANEPAVFGRVAVGKLSPPAGIDLGPPGSADLVVTFRATHGWLNGGVADQIYKAFFDVLKPGGVLGIEQHRAGPKTNLEAFSGYVPEEKVIAIAEKAGFVLEARSEINANPKDTADWAGGVWTLPPSLRLGDVDRAKYLAVGESDRMTLRFRKPAAAKS